MNAGSCLVSGGGRRGRRDRIFPAGSGVWFFACAGGYGRLRLALFTPSGSRRGTEAAFVVGGGVEIQDASGEHVLERRGCRILIRRRAELRRGRIRHVSSRSMGRALRQMVSPFLR